MDKIAPSPGKLLAMAAFAFSCVGLALYLWLSFGGSIPLRPAGYTFHVPMREAAGLALEADVRISGVAVGKVARLERTGANTDVEIELESRYAPIPRDTRATLRQKTLLGETFVELSPGTPKRGALPDGARLPARQVEENVQLDEILQSFDPATRRDLSRFLVTLAKTTRGRGEDLSSAASNLPHTAEEATGVLGVLHGQEGGVRRLVRDSGVVFGAVGRREGAVRRLISSGERVLATTAARDRDLAETVHILPTFLRELRATMAETGRTSRELAPTVRALRPVAPIVAPTLRDVAAFSPDLRAAFRELDPVITRSRRGVPAATRIIREARPLMRSLHPLARDLVPITEFVNLYRQETITSWAKAAAFTNAALPDPRTNKPLRLFRLLLPEGTETLAVQPRRLPTNRFNAYQRPRWLDDFARGLESYDCRHALNVNIGPATNVPCRLQPPTEFRGQRRAFPRIERAAP